MIFTLTFKTNDVLDQLCYSEDKLNDDPELYKAMEFAKKYVKYGEYIHIEFDSEKETVKVLPK